MMNTTTTTHQQWLKMAVLLGLALYFIYNIATGNLANYINQRFAWLTYVAVGLLIVLFIANFWAVRRGDHAQPRPYGQNPIGVGIIAVVALPLVLGTLIPSKPLGAEAVGGNITITPLNFGAANLLTKAPLERNVLDWLRVFSQRNDAASFDGEQADVIGFIYIEPMFPESHFMVARFTVSCCVADANAIGLPVYWEADDALPNGEWVRIRGTFKAGTFLDQQVPILIADSFELVEQPEHPYLYP